MRATERIRPLFPAAAFFAVISLSTTWGCASKSVQGDSAGLAFIRQWYAKVAPGHQPPPAWVFCLPEKQDTVYALGYALQNLAGDDATRKAAFENAVHNLARSVKVSVKAREYFQTEGMGLSENGQVILDKEEQVDGRIEDMVKSKARLVDEWKDMSNGVTYVLAAVSTRDAGELVVGSSHMECRVGRRPEWVDSPPKVKGMLFAVGQARMAFNPAESYAEAEEKALVELAKQIRARITGFEDRENTRLGALEADLKDYTYRIVRVATEGLLEGTDITARWVDFKTGATYVLARMPMVSLKSRILAAAKKVEQEDKAKASSNGQEEDSGTAAEHIEKKAEAALQMMEKALEEQRQGEPDTKASDGHGGGEDTGASNVGGDQAVEDAIEAEKSSQDTSRQNGEHGKAATSGDDGGKAVSSSKDVHAEPEAGKEEVEKEPGVSKDGVASGKDKAKEKAAASDDKEENDKDD